MRNISKIDTEKVKYFKLFVLLSGTIIGVGFLSGAEVVEFFARFGFFAYFGIALFFALNFFLCFKIIYLDRVKMQKFSSFGENKTFLAKKRIKDFIIFLDILLTSSAMISGLRNLVFSTFQNNKIIILLCCYVFIFVILCLGINALAKIDYFVLVFLFFVLVFFVVCLIVGSQNDFVFLAENQGSFWASLGFSVLYVFMNIVQIQPIFCESKVIFSKRKAVGFSFAFSIFLSLILVLFSLLIFNYFDIASSAMPFLTFFSNFEGFGVIYAVGLCLALFSSLIGCLIGVKRFLREKFKLQNFVVSSISFSLCLLIGTLSFSFFVGTIYPIIGIVNIFVFLFL